VVFSESSVSSTYKTDRHEITEIFLKVALSTIKQTNKQTVLGLGIEPTIFHIRGEYRDGHIYTCAV
jgi:hypothetical protein